MKLVDCTAVLRRRSEICILGSEDPLYFTLIIVRFQALKTNRGDDVGPTNPGNAVNRLREAQLAVSNREAAAWDAGDRTLSQRPVREHYTVVNWYRQWLKIERIDVEDQMKVLKE